MTEPSFSYDDSQIEAFDFDHAVTSFEGDEQPGAVSELVEGTLRNASFVVEKELEAEKNEKDAKRRITILEGRLETTREELLQTVRAKEDAEDAADEESRRVSSLNENLASTRREVNELEDKLAYESLKGRDLEKQLAESVRRVASADTERQRAMDQAQNLLAELDSAKKAARDAAESLQKSEQENAGLRKKIGELEETIRTPAPPPPRDEDDTTKKPRRRPATAKPSRHVAAKRTQPRVDTPPATQRAAVNMDRQLERRTISELIARKPAWQSVDSQLAFVVPSQPSGYLLGYNRSNDPHLKQYWRRTRLTK